MYFYFIAFFLLQPFPCFIFARLHSVFLLKSLCLAQQLTYATKEEGHSNDKETYNTLDTSVLNGCVYITEGAQHCINYVTRSVFQNLFPPDPIHQAEGRVVAMITLTNA
jgi:hypothetical protein